MDQLLRLLHACGMPPSDADLLHGKGPARGAVMAAAEPRSTLFTGSQRVAEKLALDLRGKVGAARGPALTPATAPTHPHTRTHAPARTRAPMHPLDRSTLPSHSQVFLEDAGFDWKVRGLGVRFAGFRGQTLPWELTPPP